MTWWRLDEAKKHGDISKACVCASPILFPNVITTHDVTSSSLCWELLSLLELFQLVIHNVLEELLTQESVHTSENSGLDG